jgi:subtilisin family serine protease
MKRTLILGLSALFFFFAGLVSAAGAEYREGYLLVRFNEQGVSAAANTTRQNIVNTAVPGATIKKMYSLVPGLGVVQLPSGTSVATAKSAMQSASGVQHTEPDYIWRVQAIPNDPSFGQLWGMNNTGQTGGTPDADIDAPEAWNLATGNRDVIVAVLDTGVDYTHPDLAANMWTNTAELNGQIGVDDDGNGYIDDIYGYDFANVDGDPMDDHSHGTHCSGTIAGVGNNSNGVAGVCWQVKIMALKWLYEFGSGFTSDAISAIQYAVQMGATLTSNSWGGGGYSPALYDAIAAAGAANQLFVAAAGNSASDNDVIPHYPSSYTLDNIIAVLATTDTDTLSSFSCWGATSVDIGAPGSNIYSTIPVSMGSYGTMSGTSMACPHVAGAAALVLSVKPLLTYQETKQILMSSVDKLDSLAGRSITEGRLNLYSAVLLAQPDDALPPLPDPAEWLIKPQATGLTTIVMQAKKATDKSGVEYFFDCIENDTFDSGWQSSNLYQKSTFTAGTAYSFRVKARDKSENHNETQWSEETITTTTATGVDNLPPAPNPSQWVSFPRVTSVSRKQIGMEILASYDENGVEYFFDCVFSDDPAWFADNTKYDSGWRTSPSYTVTVPSVTSYEYTFVAKARQLGTTDSIHETIPATSPKVGNASNPMVRVVPSVAYQTIQAAIDASNNGDTVVVMSGIYREINIDFRGKAITVRSQNPNNPAVVAATIIDCEDIWDYPSNIFETRRAFVFTQGEGRSSVLAGLTIRNATAMDDPELRLIYGRAIGDPDQGNRYFGAEWIVDGQDVGGGAILIGQLIYDLLSWNQIVGSFSPASPTIRNCVFENCSANGQYGWNGVNGRDGQDNSPGGHADRGGNGGNAYGGAIYAVAGSSPLITGCQFTGCRAVGGDAGNGGNGGDGGGHSDAVDNANGWRGGDGGDAGFGGCAWGGAIYFEPNCLPELVDVTVDDCFIQVGEAGTGGDGGNGSNAKGIGYGGNGGNGGAGGDLRASSCYAGAVYYGDNTIATIEGCEFKNCRVIVELSDDYSGGDGGNGGNYAGDNASGTLGGNGGHGGPAYFVPDKLRDLGGGVTATGGTGGDGGGAGNRRGLPGNGGFRFGLAGTGLVSGASFAAIGDPEQTGIWPSNMYYVSYYWEDTDNINTLNTTTDPNDYFIPSWDWEWIDYDELIVNMVVTTPPTPEIEVEGEDPIPAVPGAADSNGTRYYIFDSSFSPFYGLLGYAVDYTGIILIQEKEDDPVTYDFSEMTILDITPIQVIPLAPIDPSQPNSGACAGANYYGEGSVITMKDTIVSGNASFANHAGGELYDRGCQATVENCTFENNTTVYETTIESDYKFEGLGGGVFADQPVSMTFTGCVFNENNAFSGGGLYCNFAPTTTVDAVLSLTDTVFSGNTADHHFTKSYAGGVYAGNSFDPYEEFYFNDFDGYADFVTSRYVDHGYITFYHPIQTLLWGDNLESDYIMGTDQIPASLQPRYSVPVTDCNFVDNLSPYGAGLYLESSIANVTDTKFCTNTAHVGAGGLLFACDVTAQNNLFAHNVTEAVPTQGALSQQEAETVQIIGSGAGVYLASCDSFLTNNHFAANETNGYGGALYIDGLSLTGYPQSVFNCLFVENQAQYAGGALLAERGTDVEVLNSTFVDNKVMDYYGYGGAIFTNDAYMSITNTILRGSSAAWGPQLCVGEPLDMSGTFTTVYLDYSNIQGGREDAYVETSGYPWLDYGVNNIEDDLGTPEDESDPIFVETGEPGNAVDRTFYLSQVEAGQLEPDSPCVDAGTPTHFIYDPAVGDFIEIPGLGASSVLEWLAAKLGFDVTTRTDHVKDANPIDMGYHYNASQIAAKQYTLTLVVDRGSDDPLMTRIKAVGGGLDPFEFYSPDSRTVKAGTQVSLEAILNDPFYTVKAWHNTDDDASTAKTNSVRMTANKTVILECETTIPTLRTKVKKGDGTITPAGITLWPKGTVVALKAIPTNPSDIVRWLGTDDDALLGTTNTVTMTESKDVEVEFYTPTVYDVTGDFTELQHAVYDAKEGDIIMLRPGTYRPVQWDTIVISKNLIIQGYNPDDPATVAATTIERNTFRFTGTNRTMILNGITIRDANWGGGDAPNTPKGPTGDGLNGGSIEGGGMYFYLDASATIKNCRFVNCSVSGGDGADGDSNGDGGWGGWARGGAVYIGSGDPRFINCEFTDNYVRGGGGGDAGGGGAPGRGGSWDEVLFPWYDWDWGPYLEYWRYSGYGGAVYCDEDSAPEFKNCTFSNNVAYGGHTGRGDRMYPVDGWYKIDRYGGAIYAAKRSRLTLTQCIFEDNQADTVGPVNIYTRSTPTATIEEDPYYAYGGTIAFEDDAAVTLRDCVIENSVSHHGGGIYAEHATLTVADCNFVGNTASFGGAVYYVDTETAISRTIFHENTANLNASQGGALAAFDANSVFTDVVVVNNLSGRSGGGFYVAGSDRTTIKNGLFAGNSAGRDGGGLSVNWYSDMIIDSCTFADNDVSGTGAGMSMGGGIFVGYQSYADIKDSIVWNNQAVTGKQIAVTTGFEFDPAPSKLSIAYTDVDNYPNSNAIYVDFPSTLELNTNPLSPDTPFNLDPKFIKLPGSESSDISADYYLDQSLSPCKDRGSDNSIAKGLFNYTTSVDGIQDKGVVDLGYHYESLLAREFCSYVDMALPIDGQIDLADLVHFADQWLNKVYTACLETNNWCDGADVNFDREVDLNDMASISFCWLVEDTEAPTPNPSVWLVEPAGTGMTTVSMEAMQARDKWGGVEYYFEATSVADGQKHNSGWRQSFDPSRAGYIYSPIDPTVRAWIFEDSGLTAGMEYLYTVKTRDIAGNETLPSVPRPATPGVDNMAPTPNPALWETVPYQNGVNTIRMVAQVATDAEGNGVLYSFVCEEDAALNSGWIAVNEYVTPAVLVLGQTYTFSVRYRDNSVNLNTTAPSVLVAVTIGDVDVEAPTPNPPTITAVRLIIGPQQYHVVTCSEATDPSGVEYQFECVENGTLIATAVNVDWINTLNMVAGIYPFGSTLYPNSTLKVPNTIWIPVFGTVNYTYRARVRDQAPAPNVTDWSLPVTTQ